MIAPCGGACAVSCNSQWNCIGYESFEAPWPPTTAANHSILYIWRALQRHKLVQMRFLSCHEIRDQSLDVSMMHWINMELAAPQRYILAMASNCHTLMTGYCSFSSYERYACLHPVAGRTCIYQCCYLYSLAGRAGRYRPEVHISGP